MSVVWIQSYRGAHLDWVFPKVQKFAGVVEEVPNVLIVHLHSNRSANSGVGNGGEWAKMMLMHKFLLFGEIKGRRKKRSTYKGCARGVMSWLNWKGSARLTVVHAEEHNLNKSADCTDAIIFTPAVTCCGSLVSVVLVSFLVSPLKQ